jgi:hypothetical protein
MSEAGAAEFFEQVDELFSELLVVGDGLGVEREVVEVLVQLDGRLDAFEDDGVAFDAGDGEAEEAGDGAGRGDGGFLEPLEALKLHEGFGPTDPTAEAVAEGAAGVEFEVVGLGGALESPDLAIGAVLDEFPGAWEVSQSLFEFICRHGSQFSRRRGLSRGPELVAGGSPKDEQGGAESDKYAADGAALGGLMDALGLVAMPDGLAGEFHFAFAAGGVFEVNGGRLGGGGEEGDL